MNLDGKGVKVGKSVENIKIIVEENINTCIGQSTEWEKKLHIALLTRVKYPKCFWKLSSPVEKQ